LKSKSGPARRSCTENATLTAKKLKNDPKHGRSTAGRRKDVRSCDPTLQHASLTTLPLCAIYDMVNVLFECLLNLARYLNFFPWVSLSIVLRFVQMKYVAVCLVVSIWLDKFV
jgi:hypothetical protein